MCVCVHLVNDGWEHLFDSSCVFVGVVSPDSGCRHPGVFSFARTLLFGTLSLKMFGGNAFTLNGVRRAFVSVYLYL